jgi:hypothetical protein
MKMQHDYRVPPIDYIAIEQQARAARARAFAEGMKSFGRWLSRRPAPQGRTA